MQNSSDPASSLTFHFEIEPAEYARGLRSLARWSPYRWLGLAFVALPFIPVTMQAITGDRRWMNPGPASVFLLLTVAAYLVLGPIGQRWRVRHARRLNPILAAEHRLEFSPEGLHSGAGPATGFMAWPGIRHVREDAEFYFCYYTERCAYYLPKRLIQTDAQDEALRALIRQQAPDKGAGLAREVTLPVQAT